MQTLKLKAREERRLKQGHVWIYSNEVDTAATPLKSFESGEEVVVVADGGRPLGRALVHPQALICARLVSRDADQGLDAALLEARLSSALSWRERLYPDSGCYRLVFGEGDGLSGMVADRYGQVVVVQLNTAGMERRKSMVIDALNRVLQPRSIVFKHDGGAREQEGLESYVEVVGDDPGELVPLVENGQHFLAPVRSGQKTGWFFDHRENRAALAPYAAGTRVLDVFSYVGGWGLSALHYGASDLLAVDSSAPALDVLQQTAAQQGLTDRTRIRRGDAFDTLEELASAGERFSLVIIDPPALIKRRKDVRAGTRAYERLAALGMRVTADDGMLVFGSCSLHFDREALREALRAASRQVERRAQIVAQRGLAPDHPVHPAIPESDYLKVAFVRVRQPDAGGAL